jgi:hypothetical protein
MDKPEPILRLYFQSVRTPNRRDEPPANWVGSIEQEAPSSLDASIADGVAYPATPAPTEIEELKSRMRRTRRLARAHDD